MTFRRLLHRARRRALRLHGGPHDGARIRSARGGRLPVTLDLSDGRYWFQPSTRRLVWLTPGERGTL